MRVIERLKEIGSRRVELASQVRASGLSHGAQQDLIFTLRVIGPVCQLLERKIVATERLKRLFAKRSESSASILRRIERQQEEANEKEKTADGAAGGASDADNVLPLKPPRKRRSKKGHGRLGAKGYPNAEQITIKHPTIKAGDPCPDCGKGRLYCTSSYLPTLSKPALLS